MKKLFRIGQADHGRGKVIFRWQPEGNLLATAGDNALVHIFDRHGEKVDEFTVQGSGHVLDLAWDHEGECLAVLEQGSGVVLIWDQGTRSVMPVDTNMKELTYMIWSRVGPQLAIGTEKGNLLMYNKLTHKKIPVMGKHSKRIISGAWSHDNSLTLGSMDCSITLSEEDGTTVEQALVKYIPTDMKFAPRSAGHDTKGSSGKETTVSLNMNGKSLLLHNTNDPENPIELAFQEKYGKILTHEWWNNGYLLISFSAGYLVVISTQLDEIGEERFSERYGRSNIVTMAYSPAVHRAAVAEARALYIVDLKEYVELKKDAITLSENEGQICGVEWSPDGQILSVGTTEGSVFNYLARMPILHASYGTQVAFLSSLREVTVVPATKGGKPDQVVKERQVGISVAIEPFFLGLGRNHVGVGMNSRALFYRIDNGQQVGEQEYHGSVEALHLNDGYAAAYCASTGQVVLHTIEGGAGGGGGGGDREKHPVQLRKTLPEREESFAGGGITCVALTDNFLIYGTAKGTVQFFFLAEWTILSGAEMRHGTSHTTIEPYRTIPYHTIPCHFRIKSVCPNFLGTKVIVTDVNNTAVLNCPTSGDVLPIPQYPAGGNLLTLWDQRDRNVFFVSDGSQLHTYVHAPTTMTGGMVTKVGHAKINKEGGVAVEGEGTEIPQNFMPIVSYGGAMTCQLTSSGAIGDFICLPYERVAAEPGESPEVIKQSFLQNLCLMRLKAAWKAALQIDTPHYWLALCNKAMEVLDIDMAIQVYRQLGDAGMVMGLERIAHVEDKNLLAGHMALLFCDYQAAQDLFLSSSRPISALEMRRDLLHWDQALKLARTLAPQEVPGISVEYGQQLEFKGDYQSALGMYEGALRATDGDGQPVPASDEEQGVCMAGIARCTLRMGDVRRGIRLAKESGEKQLFRECAGIMEDMKQLAEAAAMFELGEQYDRAAALHLSNRNLSAAAVIIQFVSLPKLLTQYAKACEAAEKWRDARDAYERARDLDSVVRLCLEQLDEPEKAFEIVKGSSSSTGAEMVSKYCQAQGDWRGAIQFLLMAKRHQEAFALASSHEQVSVFTSVLGDGIGADDAVNVARYYEKRNDLGNAGKFFALCGQYHRALKLFLHCGEKEVDAAIAVVGKARNDMLTHTLIDFLMGETDGVPKDPNYIYRLYMALGNFAQAAKTAIIIARQEQDLGNYKVAHGILYETIRQLEGQKTRVPQSLRKSFVLLHSYTLVKKRAQMGDHMGAARMLLRVASNISKFPIHVVPILTSTVIECQRAGLKNSAFEYASMLMRAEYRGQVKKELRRNIEAIVRRPNREEESEDTSPCPISGVRIPSTSLECPTTKDQLPMCVITGRHVEKEDWCLCPVSRMPALYSAYKAYLEFEHNYRLKKKRDKLQGGGKGSSKINDGGKEGDDEDGNGGGGDDDDAGLTEQKEETRLGVFVGTDPVFGKRVSSDLLKKATAEEVDEYIKDYNLTERDEAGEGGEGGGEAGSPKAANGPAALMNGGGGGGGGGKGDGNKSRD